MNKLLLLLLCCILMTACSSMNVRPTVGVSVGTGLVSQMKVKTASSAVFFYKI